MIHPPRPRPVTELFPESLRLSPKQRAVLDALDEFPNGAKVGEIAKTLGMHTNTARGHLEELVAMEAGLCGCSTHHRPGSPTVNL